MGEEWDHKAYHWAISSNPLYFTLLKAKYLSQLFVLKHN